MLLARIIATFLTPGKMGSQRRGAMGEGPATEPTKGLKTEDVFSVEG